MPSGPNSGSPNSESAMADGRWRVVGEQWPVASECEERDLTPHAPRLIEIGCQPGFPGARDGAAPSASGNLRLGHAWRRASIPFQRAANTSSPRSDRFWLRELRISHTFLYNLRSICSDHGYPAQRAANTSVLARGVLSV